MLGPIGVTLLGMVLWQATEAPDISGQWTSEEWGTVVLEAKQPGQYEGTFTGSDKDKPAYDITDIPVVTEGGFGTAPVLTESKTGTIQLKWSRVERRFNGTWRKGVNRSGKMSLRLVDNEIRGAWTTSKDAQKESDSPRLADLLWKRSMVTVPDGGTVLLGGPKSTSEAAKTPTELKVPGLEKPLELQNARSVVEAYVAAALAGRVEQAASLAKGTPAVRNQIESIPRQLNVQRLAIQSVYVNDPTKPVTALATSEAVKLSKPNPDGQRDGFLLLTLTMREGGWFVTDIDFESEECADRELKKFLEANPKSIGSPPLTDNGSSGSGIDWSGYARGPHALRIIERLKPAWSDTKFGIAFGVSHTTDQHKFNPGERVPLAMFVRNTGDATLKVSLTDDFYWNVVELQDARGVSIPVERVELQELNRVYSETLKPGEAFGFLHQGLGLHDGKPRPVPFSQRGHRLEETPPYWKVPVAGTYTLRQTKEITIEGLKDTATFRGPLTSGTVAFEVIEPPPATEKGSGHEKPLDRQNARAVGEALVAAGLSGRFHQAVSLGDQSKLLAEDWLEFRYELEGFFSQFNVQRLAIKSVYVNDPAKPTTALAISEEVKLFEKQPNGQRYGCLVLKLTMSKEGWSFTSVSLDSDQSADRELKKFLEANPKSISVPPQAASEAAKSATGLAETKSVDTQPDEKPVAKPDWVVAGKPAAKPPGANIVKVPDDQYVKSGFPVDELAGEGVKWNEVQNGLSLGFRITGDEWRILGKDVKVELWVRNPGDKDVRFQLNMRPDIGLRMKMKDANGKERESSIMPTDVPPFGEHRLLPPGQAFKVKELTISLLWPENDGSGIEGHYFLIDPGAYKFHCELELPGISATGEGGKQLTPAAGEWTGKLTTGKMNVMVVAPDAPAPTRRN